MISEKDKQVIIDISRKYQVKRVLLFGSGLLSSKDSRDIDIGVEGIRHADFFRYYGDLIFALSKPVDIVDLSDETKFVCIIKKEGVPLYG